MFTRIVNAVQVVTLLAAAVFVFFLFANPPASGGAHAHSVGDRLFAANCASCHAADGSGSTGPQLSDGHAVRDFPNLDDQVRFVTNGRGSMPAFGDRLTDAQIRLVVKYTRTL